MSIKKTLPKEERPRERLMKNGPSSLSNSELLAIILRTGNKKEDVITLSNKLFNKYNIKKLSRTSPTKLKKSLGIGDAKACQVSACFELGRRLAQFKEPRKIQIKNAKDLAKILIPEMSSLKKEHLIGIYLNTKKEIIKTETIFIGSLNESVVHPREIFQIALEESAAAIIIAHNHPSGNPSPSGMDVQITKELAKSGEILGIPLLDHIVIGDKKYTSLREKRLF